MEKNITPTEKVAEFDIRMAKMIYPDRRIGKEQHAYPADRRRGGAFASGLGATQSGQPASSLNLNVRLQRLADDGRLLLDAGIFLRSGEKLVIYRNGGFHRPSSLAPNITSFAAQFHVLPIELVSLCNCGWATTCGYPSRLLRLRLRMTAAASDLRRRASPARSPAARRCGSARCCSRARPRRRCRSSRGRGRRRSASRSATAHRRPAEQPHLAAMGMAGQLQRDARRHPHGDVGLMRQQHDRRIVGDLRQRRREIVDADAAHLPEAHAPEDRRVDRRDPPARTAGRPWSAARASFS